MNLSEKLKLGSQKTAYANPVKFTFRELVTFKLLISICSLMFLYFILFYFAIFYFSYFFYWLTRNNNNNNNKLQTVTGKSLLFFSPNKNSGNQKPRADQSPNFDLFFMTSLFNDVSRACALIWNDGVHLLDTGKSSLQSFTKYLRQTLIFT